MKHSFILKHLFSSPNTVSFSVLPFITHLSEYKRIKHCLDSPQHQYGAAFASLQLHTRQISA